MDKKINTLRYWYYIVAVGRATGTLTHDTALIYWISVYTIRWSYDFKLLPRVFICRYFLATQGTFLCNIPGDEHFARYDLQQPTH